MPRVYGTVIHSKYTRKMEVLHFMRLTGERRTDRLKEITDESSVIKDVAVGSKDRENRLIRLK